MTIAPPPPPLQPEARRMTTGINATAPIGDEGNAGPDHSAEASHRYPSDERCTARHHDRVLARRASVRYAPRIPSLTRRRDPNSREEAWRIVYGGVVISLVRALSYNGLGNAFHIAAVNGGRHVAPTFAGDTIYAWSEILEKAEIPDRRDVGALRVRLVGVKNQDCASLPLKTETGEYAQGVVLDLDTWLVLPR